MGEAIARRFAAEGAGVVPAGDHSDKLQAVAADLPTERTLVHRADVADLAEVDALVAATVERFGGLHVRISNAGMSGNMQDDPELMRRFKDRIPLNRGADPAEVASVVAFLASDDESFINGALVPADGGLTAFNGQPRM